MKPFPLVSFFSLHIKRWQYIIPSKLLKTYSLLCYSRGTQFLGSLGEDVQSQASRQPGILMIFELQWYVTTQHYYIDQQGEEILNCVQKKKRFKNCKGFWYKQTK